MTKDRTVCESAKLCRCSHNGLHYKQKADIRLG